MRKHTTNTAIVLFGAERWGREDVPAMFESLGVKVVIPVPEVDTDTLASELNEQFDNWYALALDDFVGKEACALAAKAPTAMYPIEAYKTVTHKHLLRKLWNRYAAQNPDKLHKVGWALYNDEGSVLHDNLSYDDPLIVKPNAYAGSIATELVHGKSDMLAAVERTIQTMSHEAEVFGKVMLPDTHVLVEEAIPRNTSGKGIAEYSVHMLSVHGGHQAIAFSEKNINPKSFIETSHMLPADLDTELQQLMVNTCTHMLTQLQVENTISNWEFIVTPEGKIGLIEGQLRPSGDKLMHLIEMATGSNVYQYWLNAVLGETTALPSIQKHATVVWLKPQQILHKIERIELPKFGADHQLLVDEVALLNAVNWPGPVDWYNRHIAIVVSHTNKEQLMQKVTSIAEQVSLQGTDAYGTTISTACILS